MKHIHRRTLALLLALSLSAGLGAPAWAAEAAAEAPEAAPIVAEEPMDEADLPAEAEAAPELETDPEEAEPEAETGIDAQPAESEPEGEAESASPIRSFFNLQDADDDKDLISSKEAFVRVGKNKTISLKSQPKADTYFVSKNSKVVSVQKTGKSMVIKGVSVGKTSVEMRRSSDDAFLDSVTVYGFRPSTTSQASGSREHPGDLTVTTSNGPKRVYDLTCQKNQDGKSYKKYLSAHGCTLCSVTGVCSAYGNSKVTVDWLLTKDGMEEVALRSGTTLKDKTLGYYGMQSVLDYAGISSKVYNWKDKSKDNVEAAKEELVKALSAGRPVMMFMDKHPNGKMESKYGKMFGDMHCITMVGISESGKLLIANSIYPQGISSFKYKGKVQELKITPGEMLDYFVRHSKMKRKKEDDFYFTKYGGLHTFLEVTCDKARPVNQKSVKDIGVKLDKTSYTYTGEAFTPKVIIGSLKDSRDFKVIYSDNIKAGTARVTVVGMGDNYCGFERLKFTIKRAKGEITASDKTLTSKDTQQTVKLGATSKGEAKLSYSSSDDAVAVSDTGVVTIPSGYSGKVTITIKSEKTANVDSATKTVTITVNPNQKLLDEGKIQVSDKLFRQSTKDRLVPLNAVAQKGAVLTYSSKDVKVSKDGIATIPKEFVGVVKVTVTAQLPPSPVQTEDLAASDGTSSQPAPAEPGKKVSKTVRISIKPRRVVTFSVKAGGKGTATVRWKKANKVNGFQIICKGNGKKVTKTVKNGSATSYKLTGLKKGKSYQVYIQSYTTIGKNPPLYSGWSSKKTFKAK